MNTFFKLLLSFLLCLATGMVQAQGVYKEKVICESNPEHSYALYLPEDYDESKTWPVLFLFAASGQGQIGVQVFKEAADQYGYILAGSYNYKNGPLGLGYEAASILIREVSTKYAIDPYRVYTGGMSGGARMASTLAVSSDKIAGVIAIGAVFNHLNYPKEQASFDLVGISGDKDMNYREMPAAMRIMRERYRFAHTIVYDGKHHWCSPKQAKEALAWLEMMASVRGIKPNDQDYESQFMSQRIARADSLIKAGELVAAHDLLESLSLVEQAPNHPESLGRLKVLKSQKDYRKQRKQMDRVMNKELQRELEARKAFVQISMVTQSDSVYRWWETRIGQYRRESKKAKTPEARNSATRTLGFIGLQCFSTGSNYLYSQQWSLALPIYKVAALINPDHADVNYLMAKLYALNGQEDRSLGFKEKALKAGFTRPDGSTEITAKQLKDPNELQWLGWRVVRATF